MVEVLQRQTTTLLIGSHPPHQKPTFLIVRRNRCLPPLMYGIDCYADEYKQCRKQHVVQPTYSRRQADHCQQTDEDGRKTAQRCNDASDDAKSKKSLIVHKVAPRSVIKQVIRRRRKRGQPRSLTHGVAGKNQRGDAKANSSRDQPRVVGQPTAKTDKRARAGEQDQCAAANDLSDYQSCNSAVRHHQLLVGHTCPKVFPEPQLERCRRSEQPAQGSPNEAAICEAWSFSAVLPFRTATVTDIAARAVSGTVRLLRVQIVN